MSAAEIRGARLPEAAPRADASMEPRHVCRGNCGHWGHWRGRPIRFNGAAACLPRKSGPRGAQAQRRRAASMEPRHVCRGNLFPGLPRRLACACFNGAAACLPRKSRRAVAGRWRSWSFNGAAACLPRKLFREDMNRLGLTVASMEPRHVCRGNTSHPPTGSDARRGFNGAAACLPRKSDPARLAALVDELLQWSRGMSAAEIVRPVRGPDAPEPASMEPRHVCRGNLTPPRKMSVKMSPLQWSRGMSAAEIRGHPRRCFRDDGCFNGAAACLPRK